MPMRLAIRLSLNDPQSLTNSYYESPMELHDFSPIRNDYPILSFHPSLSANMRALSSICVKGVCRLNRKQEVPNLPLQIKYMQNEEQPECT